MEAIKKDVMVVNLTGDISLNRAEWKKQKHVVNPKKLGQRKFTVVVILRHEYITAYGKFVIPLLLDLFMQVHFSYDQLIDYFVIKS